MTVSFSSPLEELVRELELPVDLREKLARLVDQTQRWNQALNLTGAKTPEAIERDLIADALTLAPLVRGRIESGRRWADVGTGGGFPGLPLAICFPQLRFMLIESVQKKCRAARELAQQLQLANVEVRAARAETLGAQPEFRERFDFATARAAGVTPVQAELALPLLQTGGLYFLQQNAESAVTAFAPVFERLGGKLRQILPNRAHPGRVIALIEKVQPTPRRYPRKPGVPAKQPL